MADRPQRKAIIPNAAMAVSGVHRTIEVSGGGSSDAATQQEVLRLRAELERAVARAEDLEARLARAEEELAAFRSASGAPAPAVEVDAADLLPEAPPPPLAPPLPPLPVQASASPAPSPPEARVSEAPPSAPDGERSSRLSLELGDRASYPMLKEMIVTADSADVVEPEPREGEQLAGADEGAPQGRRVSPRQPCSFTVEFITDTHFITGLSLDLSTGGVFVATYQELPVGTPLNLSFELPSGTRVEAKGEVRWRRGEEGEARPGLGVAFTEIAPDSLRAVTRFCRRRPPLFFDV